ncbi:phenylalanine--tRNA ligase subunit alpha, partial [Candidatus Woesebacteria bacterium CG06_land_8_20_14_3_00_39_27]
LEGIRIAYLGRSGKLTGLVKSIKNVPEEDRGQVGILINEAKNTIIEEIANKKNSFKISPREWFDPTI